MERVRLRHIIFAAWPVALALLLLWENDTITAARNLQRALPFLFITLGKLALVVLLVAQHHSPPYGTARWKFWEWLDPVTTLLVFMFLDSASYYASLWGNQSGRFSYETWMFDLIRITLFVVGYIILVVAQEMITRAVQARKERSIKQRAYYDIKTETEEEE